MYKIARRWQLGRYMNLFAREGMLYFLAYVHISSFLLKGVNRQLSLTLDFVVASCFSNSSTY